MVLLKVGKAAERLGVSVWSIRKYIDEGTLVGTRINNMRYVEESELDKLIPISEQTVDRKEIASALIATKPISDAVKALRSDIVNLRKQMAPLSPKEMNAMLNAVINADHTNIRTAYKQEIECAVSAANSNLMGEIAQINSRLDDIEHLKEQTAELATVIKTLRQIASTIHSNAPDPVKTHTPISRKRIIGV